jgi:hypothetical protein
VVLQIVYVFYQMVFHKATREVIVKQTRILLRSIYSWIALSVLSSINQSIFIIFIIIPYYYLLLSLIYYYPIYYYYRRKPKLN